MLNNNDHRLVALIREVAGPNTARTITGEVLPLNILFSRQVTLESSHLDVVEFMKASRRTYKLTKAHLKIRPMKLKSLVLYIPGWWNTPNDESSVAIVNSLLQRNTVVFLLDTCLSFCRGYVDSASRITAISNSLFSFMEKLHQDGFPMASVHIVGFSLGAHVAGAAGRLVHSKLYSKFGKITALDPARPCFARTDNKLEKNDALFVQVIHASTGVLGVEEATGHVDVYINGLSGKQPECRNMSITFECDHAQAWKLYSASVVNENSLTGRRCESWRELERENCTGDETVLGYGCRSDVKGVFLYKSKESKKRQAVKLKVFNPLDFRTWFSR